MKNELDYQDVIDELYTKQNIVIVPQHMIQSSLDLVPIQYQLVEISDIIQTQNRINRIEDKRVKPKPTILRLTCCKKDIHRNVPRNISNIKSGPQVS